MVGSCCKLNNNLSAYITNPRYLSKIKPHTCTLICPYSQTKRAPHCHCKTCIPTMPLLLQRNSAGGSMVINTSLRHGRAQQKLHSIGRRISGKSKILNDSSSRAKEECSAVSGIATQGAHAGLKLRVCEELFYGLHCAQELTLPSARTIRPKRRKTQLQMYPTKRLLLASY